MNTNTESTLVTHYPSNIRSIRNLLTGRETRERKVLSSENDQSYYRYVVSNEIPVTMNVSNDNPTGYTYRLRYIQDGWRVLPNVTVNLHITIRTNVTLDSGIRTSSSVSIEVELSQDYPPNIIDSIAREVMRIHNGWDIPNMASVIDGMRSNLTSTGLRTPNQLQRPFDLTWRNVTYENLIEKRTAISFKADGVRMLLCRGFTGTFFVTSNLQIVPLNLDGGSSIILIDGELMGNTYWAFDLLYANNTNYQDRNYSERHAALENVVRTLSNINTTMKLPVIPSDASGTRIDVRVKPIVIPESADEFFRAVDRMLNPGVESDGLILTPVNQSYSENVYKWKPTSLMTVDFFVGRNEGRIELGTFRDGQIAFHPELEGIVTSQYIGTVSEFSYDGGNKWTFVRPRYDKATPNSEVVYEAISRLHADPLTREVMTGRSLRLMRRYHNAVKDQIYDYLASQGARTLTDIGSGRGGDLRKWMRNSMSVEAIEPDPINIEEMIRRSREMGAEVSKRGSTYEIEGECWNATLYPIKAEDYVASVTTEALTSFNSATFLGPSTLRCLVEDSVNDAGYVVLFVIDGKRLASEFLSAGAYDSPLIRMERVPCPAPSSAVQVGTETFGDLGCIFIQLKDSATVDRGQIEGLVDVNVLLATMRSIGWVPETDMFLTGERLLGEEERKYSSAQRLLILRKQADTNTVIRRIYTPLAVSVTEDIVSPWGNVVRVGTLGTSSLGQDLSFVHAILQATDERYRSASTVSKAIYAQQARDILSSLPVPMYLIPETEWNMYSRNESGALLYPATLGTRIEREPGIILFRNRGHWEPLAKRDISGNLRYVW